jgi:two-component system, OmpR family, sensor kinase
VMLAGWWLVGRELRPMKAIEEAAGKIANGDLARRIQTRETESELGALAAVLNETFARLEGSFAQQARFTADAAHELRTPVSVILTHAQNALAGDGLDAESREAIEACERAAQWMRRMIGSLLQLARLDAGQETPPRDFIDLAAVAAEAVELLRPVAAGRNVTMTRDFQSAKVRGDAVALGQMVTNLVGNAIHHGREGGLVRVRVTVGNHPDGGTNGVWIEVADDGPGIPADHAARVFDRFYRVDAARSGTAGRTGLGLAISKAIVEAHHGTITVQSGDGKGAAFSVHLPTT